MIFQQTCETSTHLNAVRYLNRLNHPLPLKNPKKSMHPKEKNISTNSLTLSAPPFYKETSSPDASLPIASCCGCCFDRQLMGRFFEASGTPPKKKIQHIFEVKTNISHETNPIQILYHSMHAFPVLM